MGTQGIEDYQEAFARIERSVDSGDTDLGRLGFWRLVDQVKLDPRLSSHWADVIGRIDRKAFEARVRPRFPVWLGNTLLVAATVVLAALVPVGLALAEGFDEPEPVWGAILILVAAAGLTGAVHCPAHWLAGRLGRMRFTNYYLDGPLRIQPGLKVDYASYLRATAGARAVMHAAGALATKAVPFAVFAPVYLRHASLDYALLPSWSLWALLALGVVQIITDVVWSTRFSDWKKVRRELRIAQAQRV
jgi:hypothetical protein